MAREPKTRYLVLVKSDDDHPAGVRIYGPWLYEESARAFCAKVRDVVGDDDPGFAWVKILRRPLVKEAQAFAKEGIC